MMKKILLNIIVILLIFLLFDFITYSSIIPANNICFKDNIINYINNHKITDFDTLYKTKKEIHYFRDTIIKGSTKPSVLIFGCSFGYGYLLKEEQSVAYKLAKLTNRNVYNRSVSSYGIQIMPYILEHYNIEKEIIPAPDYILFIYIENHLYRLYRHTMYTNEPYLDIQYRIKNGKLKEIHPSYFFCRFPLFRFIEYHLIWYLYTKSSFDKNFDFMKLHFEKAKEIAEKKFPNAKIAIIKYPENCSNYCSESHETQRWKELENEGFIVIDTCKITNYINFDDKKYKEYDNIHPNEKAWDIIVPAIIKELNL